MHCKHILVTVILACMLSFLPAPMRAAQAKPSEAEILYNTFFFSDLRSAHYLGCLRISLQALDMQNNYPLLKNITQQTQTAIEELIVGISGMKDQDRVDYLKTHLAPIKKSLDALETACDALSKATNEKLLELSEPIPMSSDKQPTLEQTKLYKDLETKMSNQMKDYEKEWRQFVSHMEHIWPPTQSLHSLQECIEREQSLRKDDYPTEIQLGLKQFNQLDLGQRFTNYLTQLSFYTFSIPSLLKERADWFCKQKLGPERAIFLLAEKINNKPKVEALKSEIKGYSIPDWPKDWIPLENTLSGLKKYIFGEAIRDRRTLLGTDEVVTAYYPPHTVKTHFLDPLLKKASGMAFMSDFELAKAQRTFEFIKTTADQTVELQNLTMEFGNNPQADIYDFLVLFSNQKMCRMHETIEKAWRKLPDNIQKQVALMYSLPTMPKAKEEFETSIKGIKNEIFGRGDPLKTALAKSTEDQLQNDYLPSHLWGPINTLNRKYIEFFELYCQENFKDRE